jgi:hypothetical protein
MVPAIRVTATLRDQATSDSVVAPTCQTTAMVLGHRPDFQRQFSTDQSGWLVVFSVFIQILKDAFHLVKSLRLVMCFPIFLWSNPNSHFNHQFLLVKSTRRLRFPLLS